MAELVYDENGRLLFTKEMKEEYTLLMPQMLPVHFGMMQKLLECEGYKVDMLTTNHRGIVDEGLKYVHNDTCYPALLVIGQLIDAVKHGGYDPHKVGLLITQTGGGCRASNYIFLLRKALEKAGYGNIPVLSLNFSGLEKDSSMPMDLKFMRQALAAIYYGDLLMTLRAQTQPYELEAGAAERLQNKWLDILCDEVRHDKGYSGREMKAVMPKIAAEFAAIPVRRVPKVKVGVVGEIYVKYSPLGNNELEKFLASQDCEVNLPGLMGFVQYCAYNMAETVRLYGGSLVEKTAAEAALALIAGMEKVIIKTLKDAGYHAPMPFSELIKLPEQSHTIGMGCKMGEGWLLTAEMLELVRSGYENIVCAQPFGCLPNHICGKGMVNKIRELYPEANITPIDYDPSATRVNQENRIKLMLAVARERLSERREPPADLPKVRTSVSAKLTKPKSLCANI